MGGVFDYDVAKLIRHPSMVDIYRQVLASKIVNVSVGRNFIIATILSSRGVVDALFEITGVGDIIVFTTPYTKFKKRDRVSPTVDVPVHGGVEIYRAGADAVKKILGVDIDLDRDKKPYIDPDDNSSLRVHGDLVVRFYPRNVFMSRVIGACGSARDAVRAVASAGFSIASISIGGHTVEATVLNTPTIDGREIDTGGMLLARGAIMFRYSGSVKRIFLGSEMGIEISTLSGDNKISVERRGDASTRSIVSIPEFISHGVG